MNNKGPLKLIAILLPQEISDAVKREQQYIADHWGPQHALRTPPHITIIPPLAVNADNFNTLKRVGVEIAAETKSFEMRLQGFGNFKPRVIYINPLANPAMQSLYSHWRDALENELPHLLKRYPDRPYHPHLTLAHRDVAPNQFKQIWHHYRNRTFVAGFEVRCFWILTNTQHGWEPEIEFKFAT